MQFILHLSITKTVFIAVVFWHFACTYEIHVYCKAVVNQAAQNLFVKTTSAIYRFANSAKYLQILIKFLKFEHINSRKP